MLHICMLCFGRLCIQAGLLLQKVAGKVANDALEMTLQAGFSVGNMLLCARQTSMVGCFAAAGSCHVT